jgi:hypothetical protein
MIKFVSTWNELLDIPAPAPAPAPCHVSRIFINGVEFDHIPEPFPYQWLHNAEDAGADLHISAPVAEPVKFWFENINV